MRNRNHQWGTPKFLLGAGLVSLLAACWVAPEPAPYDPNPDGPAGGAGDAGAAGRGGSFPGGTPTCGSGGSAGAAAGFGGAPAGQGGAGGAGGEWSTCPADVPPMGACVFAQVARSTWGEPSERHLTGTVLSSSVGAIDELCGGSLPEGGGPFTVVQFGDYVASEQVLSFSMLDAEGVEWRFGFRFVGAAAPPAIAAGDVVSVDVTYQQAGPFFFFPDTGSIGVRDAQSRLLAWAGQAVSLPIPGTPDELTLQQGALACGGVDSCHAYSGFDLEASMVEDDLAEVATMPYGGGSVLLGGYQIAQSGYHRAAGPGTHQDYCIDQAGKATTVMMRRLLPFGSDE